MWFAVVDICYLQSTQYRYKDASATSHGVAGYESYRERDSASASGHPNVQDAREMKKEVWRQIGHVRLVVNDRKFLAKIVFFSYTKPASNNNPRSYMIVSAPAEQAV